MEKLPVYQLEANEAFFTSIITLLSEGGVYIWKDQMEIFKKRGNHLSATIQALAKVKPIVSDEFLCKNFRIL